jgi:hypothetical protein
MFERFTHEARHVVVRAQEESRSLGHNWIGTEHLLLGVLAEQNTPGVVVLARFGVSAENCRGAIVELIGQGGFSARDADALRTLGIDLTEVQRRVEASFGPGALDFAPRRRRRPWHRTRDADGPHIPFAPRAKRVLERSLREALALGDRHIGVEHILLGLLDPRGNTAVDVLRHLQVDQDAVRARLLAELGEAA